MFKFHHFHLICRDLEGMIRFWTETLGQSWFFVAPSGPRMGRRSTSQGHGSTCVSRRRVKVFGRAKPAAVSGYDHVAFEVTDMAEAGKRLTLEGYPFIAGPARQG